MNRRKFGKLIGAAAVAPSVLKAESAWKPKYVLSSAMYGDMPLSDVLAEVKKSGSESVDIWRKRHATHREQIEEMGDEAFQKLLKQHDTTMSILDLLSARTFQAG